jgi:NAD(P)-dependent dehydrogenase (short-subunit alcohol dehydrogenase family)
MSERKIALVSGANKSIGFEVVRSRTRLGMIVYLGSRDEAAGARAGPAFLSKLSNVAGLVADSCYQSLSGQPAPQFHPRFLDQETQITRCPVPWDSGTAPGTGT